MDEDERENTADALLSATEGLSFLVMEEPLDDEGSEDEDGLYSSSALLDKAKIFDLDGQNFIVERGRIIIETEDQ